MYICFFDVLKQNSPLRQVFRYIFLLFLQLQLWIGEVHIFCLKLQQPFFESMHNCAVILSLSHPVFQSSAKESFKRYLECIFSINDVSEIAKRHCLSDGTWGNEVGSNRTWVDYIGCYTPVIQEEENTNSTSTTQKDVSAYPCTPYT